MNFVKKISSPLALLSLLFLAPVFVSLALFYNPDLFPLKKQSQGELLSPPINALKLSLYTREGKKLNAVHLTQKWNLVYLIPRDYAAGTTPIVLLHNIRRALGKHYAKTALWQIDAPSTPRWLNRYCLIVIDPKGRIVLRYKNLAEPQGILKDIRRLVALSHG